MPSILIISPTVYCYAKLAISFVAAAVTIYLPTTGWDGQAELVEYEDSIPVNA